MKKNSLKSSDGGSIRSPTTRPVKSHKAIEREKREREEKRRKRVVWKDKISPLMWLNVFSFLDPKSLCMIGMTCKEWNQLSCHDELWTQMCISFVMRGGDLTACEGYSKRQYDADRIAEERGVVSSHRDMIKRKFDTISYYNAELSMQPSSWFKKPDAKVLFLGLNDAGKTTLLYLLKIGEMIKTIPTIGTNMESLELNGVTLNVWDVGGKKQLRGLWEVYAREGEDTELLVWVIDVHDKDRFNKSKRHLHKFISKELEPQNGKLQDVRALLVVANKANKRKWDAKRTAIKLGLGEAKAFNDPKKRREWLVMPFWGVKDPQSSPGLVKENERGMWKAFRWLVHVGFIASPNTTNNGVINFFSTLTG